MFQNPVQVGNISRPSTGRKYSKPRCKSLPPPHLYSASVLPKKALHKINPVNSTRKSNSRAQRRKSNIQPRLTYTNNMSQKPSRFSRLFSNDNAFLRIMAVGYDLIELNLLALLTSIPLISAGASLTALTACSWRMVRGEDTYLTKQYVASLKRDWKQSTILWLIIAFVGVVMADDWLLLGSLSGSIRALLLAVMVIVGLLAASVGLYSFMLISRYTNSLRGHITNAAALAVGFFPRTVAMLLIIAAWVALFIWAGLYAAPIFLLFGLSLPVYVCAWIYTPILKRLDSPSKI